MMRYVPMDSTSYFLDIGSGLGKPQWHAAIMTSCTAYGIEACENRVDAATDLLKNLMMDKDFKEIGEKVFFCHFDAGRVQNFILDNEFHPTHVYGFISRFTEVDIKRVVEALNMTDFKIAALSSLPPVKAVKYGLRNSVPVDQLSLGSTG